MSGGARLLELALFRDHRGSFFKPFAQSVLEKAIGGAFAPREVFFSSSNKNVIRGFHFQKPPADHDKIVFCLAGKTLDVVVDLRRNGGSYGRVQAFELTGDSGRVVYLPRGFGHAFLALEEGTTVGYLVNSEHDAGSDQGILWSSVDFRWPVETPILSGRDAAFPALRDFQSPF